MFIHLHTLLLVLLHLLLFFSSVQSFGSESDPTVFPKFDQSDETVSVVVGKRALLPCYISLPETSSNHEQEQQRLASFKVIWMKVNSSSVLTMEDRAINGDPRISLLHAYADDWSLQIDDIDEDDAGVYRCFINTGTYKTVTLEVKVPPRIIDELTTESYPSPVRVGSDLLIKCYAQGKPMPTVRILAYDQFDNAKIISEENEVIIRNITRHTPRRYECIASNGYPPDVARSFQFLIQYPPEVNLLINGQLAATNIFSEKYPNDVHLKCDVLMHPFEKIIWLKDGQPLTNHYQIYQSNHAVISEMTIRLFSDQDQGEYTCLASNGLGTSSKSIQLLALSTTAPTRTTNAKKVTHRRKRPKYSRIHAADSTRSRATESLRMMTISSPGIRERFSSNLLIFSITMGMISLLR